MEYLHNFLDLLFGTNNQKNLYAIVLLVFLDYVTGVCVAIRTRKLSSSIGARGIAGKVMIFALVALSNVVDTYLLALILGTGRNYRRMHSSIGVSNVLESVTILFYCTNEVISIMENAGRMGMPIPQKLVSILQKLKEKSD